LEQAVVVVKPIALTLAARVEVLALRRVHKLLLRLLQLVAVAEPEEVHHIEAAVLAELVHRAP
jgi:hypothetical protein